MNIIIAKLNKIANDIEDFATALDSLRLYQSSAKIKLIVEELRDCIKELDVQK